MFKSELPSEKSKGLGRERLRNHLKLVAPAVERRRKQRMQCSYPARVRVRGANGATFETDAVLRDLSACGLRLRLRRGVPSNTPIFVVVEFLPPWQTKSTRLVQGIAVRGVVRRLEPQADGTRVLGIEFRRHRFVDIANEQAQFFRSLRHHSYGSGGL